MSPVHNTSARTRYYATDCTLDAWLIPNIYNLSAIDIKNCNIALRILSIWYVLINMTQPETTLRSLSWANYVCMCVSILLLIF